MRVALVMTGLAVALTAVLVPPASAQALAAPEAVEAQSRSLGLAVDISWTAAPGAAEYEVLRSEDNSEPIEYWSLVATTAETAASDLGYTVDATWHYRVRAIAPDGAEGALSAPASVTTSSELLPGLDAAFAWIRGQQEAAQGFRVTFDQPYDAGYRGRVAGSVEGVESLASEREKLPFVAFSQDYAGDYVGPVSGVWRHVQDPERYRVDVFSVSDAAYLQGSFALRADGTWNSGEAIARGGEKRAVLVRRSDDLVVATSGQPETRLRDVAVQIFSRTDADYLQEEVGLAGDGSFRTTVAVAPGTKIARLVNTRTGRVINSTEWADAQSYQGLVRSFWIPQDDPDYGYSIGGSRSGYRLEQRSFIYDDALAILALLREGQTARAEAVLAQLTALQNPDGSLDFSYDTFLGRVADHYRRTGAMAWVGYAAVQYSRETNDSRFDAFTERLADHLLSLQVTEANGFSPTDPRFGSILGGRGRYAGDGSYTYEDVLIEWVSTEHNIDAYFFLRDLGRDTGEDRYADAADAIRDSLLTNHWNAAESRFYQGVAASGPDSGRALDLVSWGGLFLLAVGEEAKARTAASQLAEFRVSGLDVATSLDPDSYNATYHAAGPIDGYRPYADSPGYDDPPAVAWSEGTWGALLLRLRLGEDITQDLRSMARLQAADPRGGMLQVTRGARELPWEFHVWPSVAGSAWQTLVIADAGLLWAPQSERAEPVANAMQEAMAREGTGDGGAGVSQTFAYIAPESADGFSVLGDAGATQLTPSVQEPATADEAASDGDRLVFRDTAPHTDTALTGLPDGVRATVTIDGTAAPTAFAWSVDDPSQQVVAGDDDGATIRAADGALVAAVAAPTAVDASGDRVPARMLADGDKLRLDVDHHGADFPVTASFELAAASMSPPGGGSDTPACEQHYEDHRPFVGDVDTQERPKGPRVRWGVKLKTEWVGILAAAGHVRANFRGRSEVQSSKTFRMVDLGGPQKKGVLINYHLHSSIYELNKKAGHRYLRWGDYVQMFTVYRSRSETTRALFTGRTSMACEPRKT